MKKNIILFITSLVMMLPNSGWAQTQSADEFESIKSKTGYAIVKDITAQNHDSQLSLDDMVVKAGRLCVIAEGEGVQNCYFELVNCCEYFVIDKDKDKVTYYQPSQDEAPERYVEKSVFSQSIKKVNVYEAAPKSWKKGAEVTLVPQGKFPFCAKVVVKPIVIKDKNAVYVETSGWGDSFEVTRLTLYNQTVYRLTFYDAQGAEYSCSYCYRGLELSKYNLDSKGEFLEDFASVLKVSDNGFCSTHGYGDDARLYRPCSELSCVIGEIPNVGFVGWISATQMVIDDIIYNVK